MKFRCIAFLIWLLSLQNAHAIVQRSVSVSEVLIGMTDTHAYILRTLRDDRNQGFQRQYDVMLISRELNAGFDDEIWPVSQVLDYGHDYAEQERAERVEDIWHGAEADPFAILRARGAYSWMRENRRPEEIGVTVRLEGQQIILDLDERIQRFDLRWVEERLRASLSYGRSVMPFIETREGEADPIETRPVTLAGNCEVDGIDFADGGSGSILIRLSCLALYSHGVLDIWVVLAPEDALR